MNQAITTAVITSLASICVAVIALVQAQRVKKTETDIQKQIAELTSKTQKDVAMLGADVQKEIAKLTTETQERLGKLSSDTSRAIEQAKEENDRRRQALELAAKETEPFATVIAQIWQSLQTVKDALNNFSSEVWPLAASPRKLTEILGAVHQSIVDAGSYVSTGYKEAGAKIPEDVRNTCHGARHALDNVSSLLVLMEHHAKRGQSPQSAEIEALRSKLVEARKELNGYQLRIADHLILQLEFVRSC